MILKAFWQHKFDIKDFLRAEMSPIEDKIVKILVSLTFFPQIYALFCRILSRQMFTHFNLQHTSSKREGAGVKYRLNNVKNIARGTTDPGYSI